MKEIDFNGDIKDVLSEIHQDKKEMLSKKFAYTYLIFDCDAHHSRKNESRTQEEIIYLYGCGLYNGERFERSFSEEKENPPTYLYYKDILVRDFRMVRGFIPYAYEIFGYINYKGKDLKLDVSRNEIIGGYKNLSNEFNKILLRYKKETETDVTVLKFLDKMLLYDEKELN